MQYDEFIDKVQERAHLENHEEAERATEAALATLGERLYRTKRKNLASQLPDELKEYLCKLQNPETSRQNTERFSLEEFYNRVSARAKVRYSHGVEQAKAVMSVLREAISEGELKDILAELPSEYGKLFAEETEEPQSSSA